MKKSILRILIALSAIGLFLSFLGYVYHDIGLLNDLFVIVFAPLYFLGLLPLVSKIVAIMSLTYGIVFYPIVTSISYAILLLIFWLIYRRVK